MKSDVKFLVFFLMFAIAICDVFMLRSQLDDAHAQNAVLSSSLSTCMSTSRTPADDAQVEARQIMDRIALQAADARAVDRARDFGTK